MVETVELIVECTMDEERERYIQEIGTVKHRLPLINSYVIELPRELSVQLRKINGIKAIHQNANIAAQMNSARKTVCAERCIEKGFTGQGVGIAILDTGIELSEDFIYPKNRIIAFKDFTGGNKDAYDNNCHGTHVAGICAGNGFNSGGKYAGIATEANIVAIKILDSGGKGNSANVLAGIQWMVDNKDIYNIP